jgi:hypothetical protein
VGWLRSRRADSTETVEARALVVPYDAQNAHGNVNNLSPDARAKTQLRLVVSSAGEGVPQDTGQQAVLASVPNWLRIVLYYAGSNYGPSAQLPAEIHVPVRLEASTGRIVEVDVDLAAAELDHLREVGTEAWKDEEGPLADVRGLVALPGAAVRGAKGWVASWRSALSGGDGPGWNEQEAEQGRRTANALRYTLERNPKQLAKVRASALEAGPMMADGVRGGVRSVADFEHWLEFQLTSGAVTAEEVAGWRSRAGLG